MDYAVINGAGIVSNVIIAESKEIAESVTNLTCVLITENSEVGIGWSWDGTNFARPVDESEPEVVSEEEHPA